MRTLATWVSVPAAIVSGSMTHPVHAQEGAPRGENAPAGVEEVIVTALRRSENLQDVPIAIQALTAAALESSGITGTDTLSTITPGLNFTRSAGSSAPFLRGVGSPHSSGGNEASVATYVDGVYYASNQATIFSFNNIERVEVLKGPQGTLFGRNATGGLIHVITKDPSHELGGKTSIGYGNLDTIEARGYLTGGLSETVAADVAVTYRNQREGYGVNLGTGNDVQNGEEVAVRSKWLVEPSDSTKILAVVDYMYSDDTLGLPPRPEYGVRFSPAGILHTGGFYDVDYAFDPSSTNRAGGISVQLEQELSFADLVTITSYRRGDKNVHRPLTGGFINMHINGFDRFFTQEVQLRSRDNGGPLGWISGLYYFYGDSGRRNSRDTGRLYQPTGLSITNSSQKTNSYSAFGELTYDIRPGTEIIAGVRYTVDERTLDGSTSSDGINYEGVPANIPRESTFREPSWRVAISQELGSDVMAYASLSRGFKSGVYNTGDLSNPPVNPEILDAYEIGMKSTLLDRSLRLNLAAFFYDYSDIQLVQFNGVQQKVLNAAKAEMYGLDGDLEAAVTDRLTLRAGFSVLESEYTEFRNAPVFTPRPAPGTGNAASFVDVSGNTTINAPPVTWNASVDYVFPAAIGDLSFSAIYYYNDGWYPAPSNRTRQESYSLVNAQIGWRSGSSGMGVTIWGRNLSDEEYAVQRGENASGDDLVAGAPRTYGITLDYQF